MEEKAFCPTCRKKVNFTTEDHTRTTQLDSIAYEYPVKVAYCNECGDTATYKPYQEAARLSFAAAVQQGKNNTTASEAQDTSEA